MKKLSLSLDDLRVESFETEKESTAEGTVFGHVESNQRCNSDRSCLADTCYWETCMDCEQTVGGCTGEDSCGAGGCLPYTYNAATCPFSCHATCTCTM